MGIGVEGRIGDEEAQIQVIAHIWEMIGCKVIGDLTNLKSHTAKDHSECGHHYKTAKVENIKAASTPYIFDGLSQWEIADQTNGYEENISIAKNTGKYTGKKSPNLTLQDQIPVKAEGVVKGIVIANFAQ